MKPALFHLDVSAPTAGFTLPKTKRAIRRRTIVVKRNIFSGDTPELPSGSVCIADIDLKGS